MDLAPYDFIMNHSENDLKRLNKFVHRTFNSTDLPAAIFLEERVPVKIFKEDSIFDISVAVFPRFFTVTIFDRLSPTETLPKSTVPGSRIIFLVSVTTRLTGISTVGFNGSFPLTVRLAMYFPAGISAAITVNGTTVDLPASTTPLFTDALNHLGEVETRTVESELICLLLYATKSPLSEVSF